MQNLISGSGWKAQQAERSSGHRRYRRHNKKKSSSNWVSAINCLFSSVSSKLDHMAEPPKTQILQFMQYFICYVCALAFLGCTTFTAHIVRLFEGIHQASPEGTNRTLSVSKSSPRKEMKKFAEGFGWGGVSSANETRCNNYLIVWKVEWSLFLKR